MAVLHICSGHLHTAFQCIGQNANKFQIFMVVLLKLNQCNTCCQSDDNNVEPVFIDVKRWLPRLTLQMLQLASSSFEAFGDEHVLQIVLSTSAIGR